MNKKQKVPNYKMVGHHERLWMPKNWFLLFFLSFGWFLLACKLFLFVVLLFNGLALLILIW
jgi:hypothetical protein